MMIVGLTGKACSGKNVVADLLVRETGWPSIDFDKLGWPVLEESHQELVELFGKDCITTQGTVDHLVIRQAMYRNPALRKALEAITHPKIVAMGHHLTEEARKKGFEAIIWNAPLLQRVHLDEECDVVIFVEASEQVRLRRAMRRDGMDERQFAERERNQWDIDESTIAAKAKLFTVVNNDDDLKSLHRQIADCCAKMAEIRKDRQ